MDDVLSQDEVDALMRGMDGGDIETEDDPSATQKGVKSFDFANQERIVRGRLPALDIINERFARAFQREFNEWIMASVEVMTSEVKIVKMIEYQRNLFFPTSLNVMKITPLNGAALFTLDSKLIFTAVDLYYGGTGLLPFKIEGREYTPVENKIISIILTMMREILTQVWKPVMDINIEIMHTEMNPKFANIVDQTEMVVVNPINIRFEGVEGRIDIVMPYSMLEPIRDKLEESLQALQGDTDSRWAQTLEDEAKNITVPLKVELTRLRMSMKDILTMDVGDVIPLDMPEEVPVKVQDITMMRGRLVTSKDKKAVKISRMLSHPAYTRRKHKLPVKEWLNE